MTSLERIKATYEFRPVDHLIRREFYIWTEALDRWKAEGMPSGVSQSELFSYDPHAGGIFQRLGWCEPAFVPPLTEMVLEETDEYQIIRDAAGRTVKFFQGRRHGFMPTYLKHAVAGQKDWEEEVRPLLDPAHPQRWVDFDKDLAALKQNISRYGDFVTQHSIGGYMYLRALVGPEEICYLLVDNPALVHQMMQTWLELVDAVTARLQQTGIALDQFFIAEDICYNHGMLISPDMVREFLLPYYQQILRNIRSRQSGSNKHLYFQVDTDGNCNEAIDVYREAGMDVLSPFEIAAGNDVVAIATKYPDLVMIGGIDKRVLAAGPEAIDDYLQGVIPFMVKRGGYIPTCDHGVPDNVSYANYMHYRRRIMELD